MNNPPFLLSLRFGSAVKLTRTKLTRWVRLLKTSLRMLKEVGSLSPLPAPGRFGSAPLGSSLETGRKGEREKEIRKD